MAAQQEQRQGFCGWVNGFMFPFQVGAALVVPAAAGYIFDIYRSYDLAYVILIALAVTAIISALLAARPSKSK